MVQRTLSPDGFVGLRRIGVDEFSYRTRHHYITIVVDHDTGNVIWAGEGRSAATLDPFFELLGPDGCARLETATMDMSASYQKAVRTAAPAAQIVFDRFHVQQLVSRALDETRRTMVRELKGTQWAKDVKNLRYVLLRHGEALSIEDLDRLDQLKLSAKKLFRAHERKEDLVAIMDEQDPEEATRMLRRWLGWAARSRLPQFVKVGRTIRKHFDDIVRYFQERLSNGLAEGINNKIRVAARMAYGFPSAGALIATVFLIAGGIKPKPQLPLPSLDDPLIG